MYFQNLYLYFIAWLKDNVHKGFSADFYFFQILGHLLLLWEAIIKFIWLWNKFWVKSSVLLGPECTPLLLRSKLLEQNYWTFFLTLKKRARKLLATETKTITENTSNWDHFGVEVTNKPKYDEKYLLRASLQNLNL